MQDPEMMREAQRMMQDPQFQLQMQQMMQQQKMQQAIQATKQTIADPHKLKQLELKTKLALADGEKKLAALEKEQQQKKKQESTKKDNGSDGDIKKAVQGDDVGDTTVLTDAEDGKLSGDHHDTDTDESNNHHDNTELQEAEDDIPDLPALSLN